MTDDLIAEVWVPGKAAPKGSLRAGRNGRLREDNERTTPFREQVRQRVHEDLAARGHLTAWRGPAAVLIVATFAMPKRENYAAPVTRATGDVDKLSRTVLDALQDNRRAPGTKAELPYTGALGDDAQVIRLETHACYAASPYDVGTLVRVVRLSDDQCGSIRRDLLAYAGSVRDRARVGG